MESVLCLWLHAVQGMTIPSCLSSEMHLQKFIDQTKFQSWIVNFRAEVCEKNEESRTRIAVDQQNQSSQLAEGHHQSEIIYGSKISLIVKNWIWWWWQNWNGATTNICTSKGGSASKSKWLERTTDFSEGVRLLVWSAKLPGVERGKTLTPSGRLENVFSGRLLGLVQEETIVIFYTHVPRDTETMWKEVGDARKSHPERASFWVPKVKEQTDVKSSNSVKASLATGVENPLSLEGKMKSIIPCVVVTGLETDAFVAFVAYIDMPMVRSNSSSRSRKEGVQGAVAILRRKRVQGCVSQNSLRYHEFYSTETKRIGIERFGGTHHEVLGCSWCETNSGKKRDEHLRKPHDKKIVTAKQRGIWPEKMHNAEQGDFEFRQK